MQFYQKALLTNRAKFNFGDKKLDVTIDDGRLKVGFSVPYHEIGTKRSIKSFPEKSISRLAIAILAAVLLSYGFTLDELSLNASFILMFFALLGIALCIFSPYAKFDATRIPLASGNTILIFHDIQHQAILSEIYKRRKSEILRLHGEVDMLNHPKLELKKFLWLKEEGVLSEQAVEEARAKIAALEHAASKPH
jgi:hypothetical protein